MTDIHTAPYIFKTLRDDKTIWSLPDGTKVSEDTVAAMIDSGDLVPSYDGLFPGESQTWTVRHG